MSELILGKYLAAIVAFKSLYLQPNCRFYFFFLSSALNRFVDCSHNQSQMKHLIIKSVKFKGRLKKGNMLITDTTLKKRCPGEKHKP